MAKSINTDLQAKAAKVAASLEGNFFSFKEGVVYTVVDIEPATKTKPAMVKFEFNGIEKNVEARYIIPFAMKEDFTDFATDRVWPTDNEGSVIDSVAHPVFLNKDGFTVKWIEGDYVSIKKVDEYKDDDDSIVKVGDQAYKCKPAKKAVFAYN